MKKQVFIKLSTIHVILVFFFVFVQDGRAGFSPYKAVLLVDKALVKSDQIDLLTEAGMSVDAAALLTGWSMPFSVIDIADSQIRKSTFFNDSGGLKFGSIIWCIGTGTELSKNEVDVLQQAIEHGVGVISLNNSFLDFETLSEYVKAENIQKNSPNNHDSSISFQTHKQHYITDSLQTNSLTRKNFSNATSLTVPKEDVVLSQKTLPLIIALNQSTSRMVLFNGLGDTAFHQSPVLARLFRKAVLWTIGYGLYRTYPDTVLLRLDDPGAANPYLLKNWNFVSLNQDEWKRYVFEPMEKRSGFVNIFMVPGIPNQRVTAVQKSVLRSWQLPRFVDSHGSTQDFGSMWKAIKDGVLSGVATYQSHGLTHIHPNLEKWKNAPDRFLSSSWFKEFYYRSEKQIVPVDIQASHLSKSKEWLAEYFGHPPIGFGPPGDAFSYDLKANNFTYKVAAENRFGLGNDKRFLFYLDGEKVIKFRMTKTRKLANVPMLSGFDLPIPVRWHDRDHRIHGLDFLEKHLLALEKKNNKKLKYISMDTFNAYLHTNIEAEGGGEINFTITPDPYFSRDFFKDQSSWFFSIIPALKNEAFPSELSFSLEGEKVSVQAIEDGNTYLLSLPKFFEPTAGLKVSKGL